jgi:hypothetical protein
VKRPYNLKTRIVGQLRRLFLWHPGLKEVRNRTRITRGVYECENCLQLFPAKEMRCDHAAPVVDPRKGFEDWNTYISRMFDVIPDGINHLCKGCHTAKTTRERQARSEAARERRLNEAG